MNHMQIWVDADACPRAIKEILFRAAMRTHVPVILVANHLMQIPLSPYIKQLQVSAGFDVADNYIAQNMQGGDLVITADIPLADIVVSQGGIALNPRGELYTKDNIKQLLSIRNFNAELRSAGIMTGGPAALNTKDIQMFANRLDKFLNKR